MKRKLVLVGASTGGPGHLKKLFRNLKIHNTSVVIAQHMSLMFIPSFADQFGKECCVDVVRLEGKTELKDAIYICEKNSEITTCRPLSAKVCDLIKETTYNPNVDILFSSAVEACKFCDVMAILLTGIGDDGARGLNELYKAGANCIAESKESAIVYGMPKRAKEINPNLKSMSIYQIRAELERFINVF
ncbi:MULTISPECIES: CheB methylesterase domain-containing protein [unclassified Campylobacter]|uniref:CheB methylesterase domain-containing protein n=1 Tax=unclassified Campylobacter TaxID=2593542 RepID=UPI0014758AD9|nr:MULTISPECIES: CheB methylesterase domain-containing protein [unclassified Campylobacter]